MSSVVITSSVELLRQLDARSNDVSDLEKIEVAKAAWSSPNEIVADRETVLLNWVSNCLQLGITKGKRHDGSFPWQNSEYWCFLCSVLAESLSSRGLQQCWRPHPVMQRVLNHALQWRLDILRNDLSIRADQEDTLINALVETFLLLNGKLGEIFCPTPADILPYLRLFVQIPHLHVNYGNSPLQCLIVLCDVFHRPLFRTKKTFASFLESSLIPLLEDYTSYRTLVVQDSADEDKDSASKSLLLWEIHLSRCLTAMLFQKDSLNDYAALLPAIYVDSANSGVQRRGKSNEDSAASHETMEDEEELVDAEVQLPPSKKAKSSSSSSSSRGATSYLEQFMRMFSRDTRDSSQMGEAEEAVLWAGLPLLVSALLGASRGQVRVVTIGLLAWWLDSVPEKHLHILLPLQAMLQNTPLLTPTYLANDRLILPRTLQQVAGRVVVWVERNGGVEEEPWKAALALWWMDYRVVLPHLAALLSAAPQSPTPACFAGFEQFVGEVLALHHRLSRLGDVLSQLGSVDLSQDTWQRCLGGRRVVSVLCVAVSELSAQMGGNIMVLMLASEFWSLASAIMQRCSNITGPDGERLLNLFTAAWLEDERKKRHPERSLALWCALSVFRRFLSLPIRSAEVANRLWGQLEGLAPSAASTAVYDCLWKRALIFFNCTLQDMPTNIPQELLHGVRKLMFADLDSANLPEDTVWNGMLDDVRSDNITLVLRHEAIVASTFLDKDKELLIPLARMVLFSGTDVDSSQQVTAWTWGSLVQWTLRPPLNHHNGNTLHTCMRTLLFEEFEKFCVENDAEIISMDPPGVMDAWMKHNSSKSTTRKSGSKKKASGKDVGIKEISLAVCWMLSMRVDDNIPAMKWIATVMAFRNYLRESKSEWLGIIDRHISEGWFWDQLHSEPYMLLILWLMLTTDSGDALYHFYAHWLAAIKSAELSERKVQKRLQKYRAEMSAIDTKDSELTGIWVMLGASAECEAMVTKDNEQSLERLRFGKHPWFIRVVGDNILCHLLRQNEPETQVRFVEALVQWFMQQSGSCSPETWKRIAHDMKNAKGNAKCAGMLDNLATWALNNNQPEVLTALVSSQLLTEQSEKRQSGILFSRVQTWALREADKEDSTVLADVSLLIELVHSGSKSAKKCLLTLLTQVVWHPHSASVLRSLLAGVKHMGKQDSESLDAICFVAIEYAAFCLPDITVALWASVKRTEDRMRQKAALVSQAALAVCKACMRQDTQNLAQGFEYMCRLLEYISGNSEKTYAVVLPWLFSELVRCSCTVVLPTLLRRRWLLCMCTFVDTIEKDVVKAVSSELPSSAHPWMEDLMATYTQDFKYGGKF